MKRNFRFYFALFFAKCTALVLKLIGRRGSSMPGSWAIILCPDFLGRIPRPKTLVGITGTNGKTTVSNLVADVLRKNGYDFTNNTFGTNVQTGVASSLIANATLLGKPKKELAVFELDERSAPRILPYLKPDLLLVTNIFRDSYKRNAHTEFITDLLCKNIPPETRLLLNADDLLCAGIHASPGDRSSAEKQPRVFFGIKQLPGEDDHYENIIRKLDACPNCSAPLEWQFIRYYHIGRARCPNCGWTNPRADYQVQSVDPDSMEMQLRSPTGEDRFSLPNANPINVYNALAAVALLREMGLTDAQIQKGLSQVELPEDRYTEELVAGKKIVLHLAKGQNPVACSLTFQNVRSYPGKKTVLLLHHDHFDEKQSVENPAWLYDTDFETLNHPDICQIVVAGGLQADSYVRMLLAGIPDEKIVHLRDMDAALDRLDLSKDNSLFILYDMYNTPLVRKCMASIREKLAPPH